MSRDDRDGSAPRQGFPPHHNPQAMQTRISAPPQVQRHGTSQDRAGSYAEPQGKPNVTMGSATLPGMDPNANPRATLPTGQSRGMVGAGATRLPTRDGNRTVMMRVDSNDPPPMMTVDDPPEINLSQHDIPSEQKLDERLILATQPDSERASSFRVLRHHIMERGRPQVIVVSSPNPSEGKTTVAVNLAMALAECNRAKVLLVEASLRRPQLAVIFRFEPPWCFAEQLAAHRHQPLLPWGFVNIPEYYLHVAAVDPRSEQKQLLDAPSFAIAMERLRLADYDHIVIDAPAVIGSAEVNLMQDAADGVLLAAFGKKTTTRDMRQAVYQLTPTKILGTVLLAR